MRQIFAYSLVILTAILPGCQSGDTATPESDAAPGPVLQDFGGRIAFINGEQVTKDQLYRIMAEAGGGEALAEVILDRALQQRLKDAGQTIGPKDIQAERDRLIASLDPDPDQATRLLREMRSIRGLGELRFESLLRRNAGLRALIKDAVTVSDTNIQQAYDVRYGQRYELRLLTADKVAALNKARKRVLDGESFTDLVVELSTDRSVRQGGLLSPINPSDSSYPKAMRDAMVKLTLDKPEARLSPVIAMPQGYALLWLEGVVSKDAPPIGQVRDELENALRLEYERVRMQQLARVLIEQANVVVLDPALDRSWKQQREAIGVQ